MDNRVKSRVVGGWFARGNW